MLGARMQGSETMTRFLVAAAMLLTMAACGPRDNFQSRDVASEKNMAMDAIGRVETMAGAPAPEAAPLPPPPPGQPPVPGTPPGNVMLAYAYTYGIEVPAVRVSAVMKAHEKICTDAGPALCQVLGSSTNTIGEYDIRGQLNLRAEPRWLANFRGQLDGDAKAAGGKTTSTNVSTEDLTRSLIDTEARLRAATTLRDRLQALLASRPGKLSDLLDVERELARVQGDIDSTQSNLAVMRTRVNMSTLTIDYASAGAPVTDTTLQPIKEALVRFIAIIAEGLGNIIKLIAFVLPWALALWLIVWLLGLWGRRRARAKAAEKGASQSA
jgi:hypothetical protein